MTRSPNVERPVGNSTANSPRDVPESLLSFREAPAQESSVGSRQVEESGDDEPIVSLHRADERLSRSRREDAPFRPETPLAPGQPIPGRQELLSYVISRIQTAEARLVVLKGPRRTGKTTLLRALEQQLMERCHPLYFDLMGWEAQPLGSFLSEVAESVHRMSGGIPPRWQKRDDPGQARLQLHAALKKLPPARPLVLLLDELGAWMPSSGSDLTGRRIYRYIQELTLQETSFRAVLAVGRHAGEPELASPLQVLNSAPVRQVLPLSEAAAQDVLAPLRTTGPGLEASAVPWLLRQSGRQPWLLQLIGEEVWGLLRSRKGAPISSLELNAHLNTLLRSGREGLDWMWDGFSSAEQQVLSAIGMALPIDRGVGQRELERRLERTECHEASGTLEVILQRLEALGILKVTPDESLAVSYSFQSELFRLYVGTIHPLTEEARSLRVPEVSPSADAPPLRSATTSGQRAPLRAPSPAIQMPVSQDLSTAIPAPAPLFSDLDGTDEAWNAPIEQSPQTPDRRESWFAQASQPPGFSLHPLPDAEDPEEEDQEQQGLTPSLPLPVNPSFEEPSAPTSSTSTRIPRASSASYRARMPMTGLEALLPAKTNLPAVNANRGPTPPEFRPPPWERTASFVSSGRGTSGEHGAALLEVRSAATSEAPEAEGSLPLGVPSASSTLPGTPENPGGALTPGKLPPPPALGRVVQGSPSEGPRQMEPSTALPTWSSPPPRSSGHLLVSPEVEGPSSPVTGPPAQPTPGLRPPAHDTSASIPVAVPEEAGPLEVLPQPPHAEAHLSASPSGSPMLSPVPVGAVPGLTPPVLAALPERPAPVPLTSVPVTSVPVTSVPLTSVPLTSVPLTSVTPPVPPTGPAIPVRMSLPPRPGQPTETSMPLEGAEAIVHERNERYSTALECWEDGQLEDAQVLLAGLVAEQRTFVGKEGYPALELLDQVTCQKAGYIVPPPGGSGLSRRGATALTLGSFVAGVVLSLVALPLISPPSEPAVPIAQPLEPPSIPRPGPEGPGTGLATRKEGSTSGAPLPVAPTPSSLAGAPSLARPGYDTTRQSGADPVGTERSEQTAAAVAPSQRPKDGPEPGTGATASRPAPRTESAADTGPTSALPETKIPSSLSVKEPPPRTAPALAAAAPMTPALVTKGDSSHSSHQGAPPAVAPSSEVAAVARGAKPVLPGASKESGQLIASPPPTKLGLTPPAAPPVAAKEQVRSTVSASVTTAQPTGRDRAQEKTTGRTEPTRPESTGTPTGVSDRALVKVQALARSTAEPTPPPRVRLQSGDRLGTVPPSGEGTQRGTDSEPFSSSSSTRSRQEPQGAYERALVAVERNKLEDAFNLLREAVRENPDRGEVWAELGQVHERLGRPEDALRAWQKAVQLDPTLPGAWYGIGKSFQARGRTKEAIQALQQVVVLAPSGALAREANRRLSQLSTEEPPTGSWGPGSAPSAPVKVFQDKGRP